MGDSSSATFSQYRERKRNLKLEQRSLGWVLAIHVDPAPKQDSGLHARFLGVLGVRERAIIVHTLEEPSIRLTVRLPPLRISVVQVHLFSL
jgi:hypothetical protein